MHKDIICIVYFGAKKGFREGDFYWSRKQALNNRLIGPQYGADSSFCAMYFVTDRRPELMVLGLTDWQNLKVHKSSPTCKKLNAKTLETSGFIPSNKSLTSTQKFQILHP